MLRSMPLTTVQGLGMLLITRKSFLALGLTLAAGLALLAFTTGALHTAGYVVVAVVAVTLVFTGVAVGSLSPLVPWLLVAHDVEDNERPDAGRGSGGAGDREPRHPRDPQDTGGVARQLPPQELGEQPT